MLEWFLPECALTLRARLETFRLMPGRLRKPALNESQGATAMNNRVSRSRFVSKHAWAVALFVGVLFAAAATSQQRSSGVSVPDMQNLQLFLLIGQSNMSGRGVIGPDDREAIPRVFTFSKEMKWVPAIDPLHFDRPNAGAGLGRSFARVLAKENRFVSIGLVPCAVGGTHLDQWKPGGELFEGAVARTRAAMKSGRLRAILWHQGEAEAHAEGDARSYIRRFGAFITALRADLGVSDAPVVVGQLCPSIYHRPEGASKFAPIMDEQLALLPLHVANCGFVSSAGLRDKGDSVHFNTPSLHEFGRRYAYAFLALDPTWVSLDE